jgi:hypothetical protein
MDGDALKHLLILCFEPKSLMCHHAWDEQLVYLTVGVLLVALYLEGVPHIVV